MDCSQTNLSCFWNTSELDHFQSKEKFSLLLLDPGEIYFEDFSVFYYPVGFSEDEAIKRKHKGRLKICSKSLVFDPLDSTYPMLKFRFRDVSHIGKWSGSLLSRLDTKGDVIIVEAKVTVSMKEANVVGPYKYIREKSKHLFSLNFVNLLAVLPQVEQLLKASELDPHEENGMVASMVRSRQSRITFNTSWIEDLYEKIIHETTGDRVTPLVCNPGRILLTSSRLYFQPFNNVEPVPVLKLKLSNVKRVVKRRYLLRPVGLEIFSSSPSEDMYLVLDTGEERDNLYNLLLGQEEISLEDTGQANMTLKWQSGAISNFDYIMYLNSQADRSLNDLTQYPVFPWVIKDYTSLELDLTNPETFRDLSKPIGALDETRLKQLKSRCSTMPEPKFLYGSHYSTPGFVLFYLVRVAPEHMLCLQNGRFDKPDRLFSSIKATWENCCTGHSDYKELIPEFYMSGEFLENRRGLNLGVRQDGTRVDDVKLPPWATDADDFVKKCRAALESQYVSENIHNWIDLVFGYKQRGEEAWKADNVFYYLTYEGAVDLDSVKNSNDRNSLEKQILEFGQTPKQLFSCPHPQRKLSSTLPATDADDILLMIDSTISDELPEIPVIKLSLESDEETPCVEIHQSSWQDFSSLCKIDSFKVHKDCVHSVGFADCWKKVFSVSQDTQLKLWSLEDGEISRSLNLSSMALSSCAVMPGSKTVIVGSWDNRLYTYSVEFGRVVDSKSIHDDAVSGICWKDNFLATSSWDSTAKLWSFTPDLEGKKPDAPKLIGEMDHDNEVTCLDMYIGANGTQIVTGTKDGQLFLWNAELLLPTTQQDLHSKELTQVLFSPDGQRVLSCGLDHQMRVIDAATGLEMYSKDIEEPIRCAAWDGQIVLAGGESGDLMVWDLVRIQCIQRVPCHSGPLRSVSVSKHCDVVVTGGSDGFASVLKIAKQ